MSSLRLEENISSWGTAPAASSNIDWSSPSTPAQTSRSGNYDNSAVNDVPSNSRSNSKGYNEPCGSRSSCQRDYVLPEPQKQESSSGWDQTAASLQQRPSCGGWEYPLASQEPSGCGQAGFAAGTAPRQLPAGSQRFGSLTSSGGYEPSPREGYVPSPRERLRVASGTTLSDERVPRPSYPSTNSTTGTPLMPPKQPRLQMTDEEFFGKYGFHFDELPTATTKLSIPTATASVDYRSGFAGSRPSFSGSPSFRSSTSDSTPQYESAPSWDGVPASSSNEQLSWGTVPKAAEQISWGTVPKAAEQLSWGMTQKVEEPLQSAPAAQKPEEPLKRSPSPSNQQSSWNAPAKTVESFSWSRPTHQAVLAQDSRPSPRVHESEERSSIQQARFPASSSARFDSDDQRVVSSWGIAEDEPQRSSALPTAEPEKCSSLATVSNDWCIDKTPSGCLVVCPQCRHEFTLL